MKRAAILLLALLAGCHGASRVMYAKAATKDQTGMRVTLEGGSILGGPSGSVENVGEFLLLPLGWTGPVPPGWVFLGPQKLEEPKP